jgi:hypothetical protein
MLFSRLVAPLLPKSLTGRIFAVYASSLFLFLGLGMALFYFIQFRQKLEDVQDTALLIAEICLFDVGSGIAPVPP